MAEPPSMASESCEGEQRGEEFSAEARCIDEILAANDAERQELVLEVEDIHFPQTAGEIGEENDAERPAGKKKKKVKGKGKGKGKASESSHGDQNGEGLTFEAFCPDEIREEDDIEKQAVAAKGEETVDCIVWNDLRLNLQTGSNFVAAELQLGQGSGWQVIYPEASLKLAMPSVDDKLQVSVRLRDDVEVSGTCTAVHGSTLMLSKSFGDFGNQATKHILAEERAAAEERYLRWKRQREINKELTEEVCQAILHRQKLSMFMIWVCLLILLGAMVACTLATFRATEPQRVGLALALLGLVNCAKSGANGLAVAAGDGVNLRLPEVLQAERSDFEELRYFPRINAFTSDPDSRILMFFSCQWSVTLVVLGCPAAMTVASSLNGSSAAAAVLWGSVALLLCCGGVIGWLTAGEGAGWRGRALHALAVAWPFPISWPYVLLVLCGFKSRFQDLLLKPAKRSLDNAVHATHDHTIVFEGNVLPGRETVCSWPGKYATAWDTLVAGSKQDDISAAVVFLPEGSKHFGLHDPIPASQDLQDLHGECWCTPLYGERKPWGCRWWSKWITNIEQAASQECTLEVYYFNGMRGKGKVKDFTTAGEEHMRREAIERRRDAFLKSEGFSNALEAGLKHLPKKKGPDSSSPYSREVHRLFLAWLPEEDRQFLVSSEGIGNSQKAEVAWLERKGYSYIEREVRELESASPKLMIGRAVTP